MKSETFNLNKGIAQAYLLQTYKTGTHPVSVSINLPEFTLLTSTILN